jgi:hypothetical protein
LINRHRETLLVLGLYSLFGALLYILVIWDLRPYPYLGWVDDYRYVQSAWYIRHFDWLGPYDPTTLIKRPLFPLLLALTSSLGLPFDQFQILFYLAGAAFFIHALLRLGIRRWITVPLFAALTFLPTIYDSDGSRVFRETVTIGVEFVILGLASRLLLLPKGTRLRDLFWGEKWLSLYSLYALAAFHWGMREEGILLSAVLAPFLFLIALWRFRAPILERLAGGIALSGGLLASIAITYLAIASANYAKYGVFLINDLSGGEFPKVVGVLKSIQEGPPSNLLLDPLETDKLLKVSPRFQQIGKVLQRVQRNNPDVAYSYEMFFLRVTALQGTKLGASAQGTQEYFRELYEELSGLCAHGELRCDPNPKLSVVPRYSADQWGAVPIRFSQLGTWLLTTQTSGFDFLSRSFPGVEPVPVEVLKHFVEICQQEPFGWDGQRTEYTLPGPLEAVLNQQKRREALGEFYSRWSPGLYGFAAPALLLAVLLAWRRRRWELLAVMAILGLHVLARISAFSYLSAVDDGGIPVRLIKPAYPFALTLAVIALCLGLMFVWEEIGETVRHRRKARLN